MKPSSRQIYRAKLRHERRIQAAAMVGDQLFAEYIADVLEVRADEAMGFDEFATGMSH